MAKEKQISTVPLNMAVLADNNLQSQHGPWANPQQKAGPYGGEQRPILYPSSFPQKK